MELEVKQTTLGSLGRVVGRQELICVWIEEESYEQTEKREDEQARGKSDGKASATTERGGERGGG